MSRCKRLRQNLRLRIAGVMTTANAPAIVAGAKLAEVFDARILSRHVDIEGSEILGDACPDLLNGLLFRIGE